MATVAQLDVKVGAKTQEFDKGLQGVKSSLKDLAGVAAVAFGGREIMRFTAEVSKLSGVAAGVENAFNALNRPDLLDNLIDATKGTVSQLELMQQAVRADNFKIPLDTLTAGLAFATRRAKETGEAVDFLVNSFVTGIGRKSALVMDNLGISATELQAEVKKVGDFATAVGNIMEREMAGWGEDIDTVNDKTQRLAATWENTKVLLGDMAVEAGNLGDNLDDVNTALSDFNTIIADEDTKKGFKDFIKSLVISNPLFLMLKGNIELTTLALEKWAEAVEKSQPGRLSLGLGMGQTEPKRRDRTLEEAKEAAELFKEQQKLKEATDKITNSIQHEVKAMGDLKAVKIEMGQQMQWFTDMVEEEAEVIDESTGLIEKWADEQATIGEKLKSIHNAIAQSFIDMADTLSTSIADLITGESGIEGFFKSLLKLVADFAVSFGRVLTAIGAGLLLLGIGPGAALVGIGVGLMTLGKIGGNIIERQSVDVSGEMRVRGGDLVTVLGRGQNFKGATT